MDYRFPKIRLGLCCMNITLKQTEAVYSSRKNTLAQIFKKGIEDAKNTAIQNVIDLAKMVTWAKNHGIDVLRISSELVPHATNPEIIKHFGEQGVEYSSLNFIEPYLKKVGHIAKKEQMRLTFHPAHFVQLGSPNETVFNNSVRELELHLKYIQMMQLDKNSVMVVHLGGTFGDKIDTMERFKRRFNSLPSVLKDRIVFENDEKCYDAHEVLKISEELNVPMVLDVFHYYCFAKYHPENLQLTLDSIILKILNTWKRKNIRPKFHVSEQAPCLPVGSHSVFVNTIPKELLEIPSKYGIEIDIMIEAKGKEFSISKLYKKYPDLKPPYRLELPDKVPIKVLKTLNLTEEEEHTCCKCVN